MPELPLVGGEFAGYRMRAVLGRGGMSVVYQAENLRLGNVIALKVLAPELAANDVFRARFLGGAAWRRKPRCSCWGRSPGRWIPRTAWGLCTGTSSRGTC